MYESESESSDSSDSSDENIDAIQILAQGDSGIIDATTNPKGKCKERLWMHVE